MSWICAAFLHLRSVSGCCFGSLQHILFAPVWLSAEAKGFPLRGSCRRQATDEVASSVCGQIMAMAGTLASRSAITLQLNSRSTSSVTADAVPPSPQGEGFCLRNYKAPRLSHAARRFFTFWSRCSAMPTVPRTLNRHTAAVSTVTMGTQYLPWPRITTVSRISSTKLMRMRRG